MRSHHHHHRCAAGKPEFANALRGAPAVQPGHLPVDEDGVVSLTGSGLRLQLEQRRLTVLDHIDGPAQRMAHALQHLARGRVVVDHQRPQRHRRRAGRRLVVGNVGGQPQRDLEMEAAAVAERAVQVQFAAHQANQPLADRHTQPGAAEAPRGRGLGLREAAEDARLVLGCDADAGVAHRDLDRHLGGAHRDHGDRHHHFTRSGELDRVAGQIDQHLLQAHGVADQAARQGRIDVEQHLQVLGADVGRHDDRQVAHQLIDAERVRIERHLAGLDLGEVEDVVEQSEQRARRALGLECVVGLARRQLGPAQQRQHAQDRVHRRADLVAHVGEKLALRPRRLLGRLGRPHQLGDVGVVTHDVSVGHAAFADAQRAAVAQASRHQRRRLVVGGHSLGHEGVDAADGSRELAALGADANDVFKMRARHHQLGAQRVQLAVALVAQHHAVVGIEQRVSVVQRIDRAAQQGAGALHLGLGVPAFRDVLEGPEQSHRPAVHELDFTHRPHPDRTPGCRDQAQFQVPAGAGGDAGLHRLTDQRLRLGSVVTQRLFQRGPVAGFQVVDAAGLVAPGDDLVDRVELPAAHAADAAGAVEERLAVAQRRLGLLALRDVRVRAGHPARPAVVAAAEQLAAVEHPDPVPVLVAHARLAFIGGRGAVEMPVDQHRRAAQVVRVREVAPGGDRGGAEFCQRAADDLRPAFVEHRLAGLDVPFPGADIGALDDVGQALALTRQVALGLLAHRNVQVDAGDHQRRAARVALGDHAARLHPDPVTFPMLQPELGLVLARQAMQVCVEGLCHGRSVVRMHQAQE